MVPESKKVIFLNVGGWGGDGSKSKGTNLKELLIFKEQCYQQK